MICSQTIETDIEYKNKNVSKNMLRIFEAHFREKIKNTKPRAKKITILIKKKCVHGLRNWSD